MSQLPLPSLNEKYIQFAVQELPSTPWPHTHYIFDKLARRKVTNNNHGLHKYPAKFIPQIPRWGLRYDEANSKKIVVLDPFCGSGTTLVEAGLKGYKSIGYDINPLAVLISRAKTSCFFDSTDTQFFSILEVILSNAKRIVVEIADQLEFGEESLGLHYNWSYWFRSLELARLLALKEAILEQCNEDEKLRIFLLVCLSSVTKASSFLNEDQIKVRKDHNKKPLDPFLSFPIFAREALKNQFKLGKTFKEVGASFKIEVGTADQINLDHCSIDRVITSPPYVNAVDYTMNHKFNLFILGLVSPKEFKPHCRKYIGMTERAVRAADIKQMPTTGIEFVDQEIQQMWTLDTDVSRNRSFVVAQYFSKMYETMKELHRVLKPDGKLIFVIGNSNRIAKQKIETAELTELLAHKAGFVTELLFYHDLSNRSSMRLGRSDTGGKIKYENIYVFRHK